MLKDNTIYKKMSVGIGVSQTFDLNSLAGACPHTYSK
jgi:hypothetical protein